MSVLVTTVFISEKAIQIMILEQAERNELDSMTLRLAAKRNELEAMNKEVKALERAVIDKANSMNLRGIIL